MPNKSESKNQSISCTHVHSRKYKELSSTMESPDSRPIDPPSGGRLPDRVLISTSYRHFMSNIRGGQNSTGSPGSRDSRFLEQRSSRKGQVRETRLCQPDVCSPQEGRQVEAHHQSKIPQSVCGKTSLQDGRHQKPEGHPSRGRSDGQIGFKRCVLIRTNHRKPSKIPTILLEESTAPIHMPTLRTEQCTLRIHKAASSSPYLSEGQRSSLSDVSGRHADSGENARGAESQFHTSQVPSDLSGISCQRGEISSWSNTGVGISGICDQLQDDDTSSNGRESEILDLTMQSLDGGTSHHNSATCLSHRCNDFNDTSCTSSTSPLSGSPTTEKCSLGLPPLIFCTDYSDSGSQTGSDLVEDTSETVEISEYSTKETSFDTGVRCFRSLLGGGGGSSVPQPENIDGRYMERDRDDTPHQLQGTSCSMVGPSVLCLKPTECT